MTLSGEATSLFCSSSFPFMPAIHPWVITRQQRYNDWDNDRVMHLSLAGPEWHCCPVITEVMEGRFFVRARLSPHSSSRPTSALSFRDHRLTSVPHHSPFPPLGGVEEEIDRCRHGNHTDDSRGVHVQGCLRAYYGNESGTTWHTTTYNKCMFALGFLFFVIIIIIATFVSDWWAV